MYQKSDVTYYSAACLFYLLVLKPRSLSVQVHPKQPLRKQNDLRSILTLRIPTISDSFHLILKTFKSLDSLRVRQWFTRMGELKHTKTITYTLMPRAVGSFTISKAEITTQNNKVLYSEPYQIKVVKSGSSTASTSKANQIKDKVFLKTIVSNKKPVIGEQVTIDYRIYTQVSIEQYQITKEPDFSRFYVHYIQEIDPKSKNRNDQWTSILIRYFTSSRAISQSRGEMILDPMIMDVGVPVNGRRSMFNPFYQIEAYTSESEKITLDVQSLLNQLQIIQWNCG